MSREHTGIKAGDLIRCPDRATARWHRVVRVGRWRDGTRYVTVKARRFWRMLGCPAKQRIEWGTLQRMGFGIRRQSAPLLTLDEVIGPPSRPPRLPGDTYSPTPTDVKSEPPQGGTGTVKS